MKNKIFIIFIFKNWHILDLSPGVSYEPDPDVSRIMEEQHNAAINLLRYMKMFGPPVVKKSVFLVLSDTSDYSF